MTLTIWGVNSVLGCDVAQLGCFAAQLDGGVAQLGCGVAQLGDGVAQLGYGLAQLLVRQLAVRQTRFRFSARYPMEIPFLLSEEAMRIQGDRPRRMAKDERMYDCTV
jgi:hypothetical protein